MAEGRLSLGRRASSGGEVLTIVIRHCCGWHRWGGLWWLSTVQLNEIQLLNNAVGCAGEMKAVLCCEGSCVMK